MWEGFERTNLETADGDLLRRYLFTYDRAGSRLSESLALNGGAPTVTNFTYNAANQMTSNGSITFGYDNNGNLITANSVSVMTWDRANRLLSATDGVTTSLYAYDGEGHRIQQTVGASVTKYLLDLQPGLPLVLAETVGANTKRFVHGPMGIHAQEDVSGVWTWAVQDALGNVRLEASNALAVNGSRNFAPYLPQFGTQGAFTMPFAATGEPTDGNGLVHLRARYLSPALGVFASLDPFEGNFGHPMSLNGYGYVHGNPVNWTDPSGLISLEEAQRELYEVINLCQNTPEESRECKQLLQTICEILLNVIHHWIKLARNPYDLTWRNTGQVHPETGEELGSVSGHKQEYDYLQTQLGNALDRLGEYGCILTGGIKDKATRWESEAAHVRLVPGDSTYQPIISLPYLTPVPVGACEPPPPDGRGCNVPLSAPYDWLWVIQFLLAGCATVVIVGGYAVAPQLGDNVTQFCSRNPQVCGFAP